MGTLRVLIVEDEEPARRLLQRYLARLGSFYIEEASDGSQALSLLQEKPWDIVFLDIEMPGMDGVSLMHFCRSLPEPPAVVFTTAYGEHAVKAFEGGAIDYLLKPFSLERLRQALERVQRARGQLPSSPLPRLPVPQKEGHVFVAIGDMVGVRIEDRIIYIETRTGEVLTTRAYTLQQLEEKLPSPPFLRIARDAIINVDAVQELVPWFSGRYKVALQTGTVYMCSRECAGVLLRALGLKRDQK